VIVKPLNMIVKESTVMRAQKKALKVSDVDQYEAPSSSVKRMPPIGALNAAAMPVHSHAVQISFVLMLLESDRKSQSWNCCLVFTCGGTECHKVPLRAVVPKILKFRP
jgi:hypothetical protein